MLRRLFPNVYEGWLVVGASGLIVLLVASSFFYGFGTIYTEVVDEFGWSDALTSLGFSLRSEAGGLAAPFIGILIDRLGPRRVLNTGILVTVAGVLVLSMTQTLWHFYAAMLVIAVGTSASGGAVGLAAIATWFEARRARAMSFMTLGGGLGGLLVIGVAWLVDEFGWRWALRLLALGMLVIGLAVATNIRARPPGHPQPMDGLRRPDWRAGDADDRAFEWGVPVWRAVTSRTFILMSLAILLLGFSTTAVVVHQIPYLERSIGASKAVAASSVAVFTLASIVGRLGFGFYADRYSKRVMLAASIALVLVGLVVLTLATTFWVAMLGILLIAPGFGGGIPVRPAMLADYFGTRSFGTVNGLMMLVLTTGGAVGPWVLGYTVDVTGGYTTGWLISTAVVAAAIPLALLAAPPTRLIEEHRPRPGPRGPATGAA